MQGAAPHRSKTFPKKLLTIGRRFTRRLHDSCFQTPSSSDTTLLAPTRVQEGTQHQTEPSTVNPLWRPAEDDPPRFGFAYFKSEVASEFFFQFAYFYTLSLAIIDAVGTQRPPSHWQARSSSRRGESESLALFAPDTAAARRARHCCLAHGFRGPRSTVSADHGFSERQTGPRFPRAAEKPLLQQ